MAYLRHAANVLFSDASFRSRVHLFDDDVSFYNSIASTWTLATPRTTWESMFMFHSVKCFERIDVTNKKSIQFVSLYSPLACSLLSQMLRFCFFHGCFGELLHLHDGRPEESWYLIGVIAWLLWFTAVVTLLYLITSKYWCSSTLIQRFRFSQYIS